MRHHCKLQGHRSGAAAYDPLLPHSAIDILDEGLVCPFPLGIQPAVGLRVINSSDRRQCSHIRFRD
jgi:hypothetical protein